MEREGKKDQRLRLYCKYSLESLSTHDTSQKACILPLHSLKQRRPGVTKTYSPFDKTFFRQSFRFSAVYYSDTSTTDFERDTDREIGGLFYHYCFEHMKVPVSSSNTQKASIQEGTLALWRYILQEHQFLDRQHARFNRSSGLLSVYRNLPSYQQWNQLH